MVNGVQKVVKCVAAPLEPCKGYVIVDAMNLEAPAAEIGTCHA